MKYVKEELEKLIFEEDLAYEEIGRKYDVSGAYIKKISKKLGINLPIRQKFPEGFVPHNKGTKQINSCASCGKKCKRKYCSTQCSSFHYSETKYKYFLEHNSEFTTVDKNMKFVKKHILKEQSNKCNVCNMQNLWNEMDIVFILDHIDGNAANNKRENLRLVCPNCDSQLPTFKNKNKNSARKERYLLLKK